MYTQLLAVIKPFVTISFSIYLLPSQEKEDHMSQKALLGVTTCFDARTTDPKFQTIPQ
jgi:hypothetical protein